MKTIGVNRASVRIRYSGRVRDLGRDTLKKTGVIFCGIRASRIRFGSANRVIYNIGIMDEEEVEGKQSEEIPSFHTNGSITVAVHQPLDPQTSESSIPIYQSSRSNEPEPRQCYH